MKTKHSAATKAAVMAALLEGQGSTKVAADFKLPEGTVKAWRARMKEHDGSAKVASVAPEKREEIGELLVTYLHANLKTLTEQQKVFADPEWLKKQDAGEVAVLHGVMTDKAIRLLEALGGPGHASTE
jgi:transposase-like protein